MTVNRECMKIWAKHTQGDHHKYKTICVTAVAQFFDADKRVHYLHSVDDLVRAVRKQGYTVRSRRSFVKGGSVGQIKKELFALGEGYYIIHVKQHVLLLDHLGRTIVDTDPKKKDNREFDKLYKVFPRKK